MRKTDPAAKTPSSTSLSSRADSRSWPNGFSTTTRRHESVRPVGEPVLLELADHVAEELRRDRQVERVVAAGAALLVELLDGAAQLLEGLVVVEVAGHEPEALGELLPHLLAELRAGVLLDRVVHDLREVLVGPVTPGEADQAEAGRQQAAVGEVVDRRHDLLARQVAGHAEEHQAARPGDPGKAAVLRVAQRVGVPSAISVAVLQVVGDQGPGRRILLGQRLAVAGDRRRDLLGQLLAELDAPLVEAVDAPHDALGEGDVLVEGDQLSEHRRASAPAP